MGLIYNRKTKEVYQEQQYKEKITDYLYHTFTGRVLLKIITLPIVSKLYGKRFYSAKSTKKIHVFIETNHIDMNLYEPKQYTSFNDFFTRKKKTLHFENSPELFVSPADAKVMVFPIANDLELKIKNSIYTLEELIESQTENLLPFQNGYCFIFRLAVNDYHRYHFIDDGNLIKQFFIKGKLHTVRSVSEKYKVYARNQRVCSLLNTNHFGEILWIEVGALLVGKIVNHPVTDFVRGQEKGYFEYGGSTIVLITKGDIMVDKDILENTAREIETQVEVRRNNW